MNVAFFGSIYYRYGCYEKVSASPMPFIEKSQSLIDMVVTRMKHKR